MWAFQYKHGDKPLEGFTIQRAAGRGGFGEVYYAVSDAGREVALKVITGFEQIELRGISQCMNLKNPHLVSIFDVKYNDQNRPFVIMEFVAGPSLRQLLDESPGGLGAQKTAFFLREIGKGLTFLHDCGIVHRDLKPGNIFYENGYVKIGDYGLSKAMEPTQHSGQTITVGTVHYMAPEVGVGKTLVSSSIIDRVAADLGRRLYEVPVGFKWFVSGLLDGSLGFGGEESAGASFLRRDGTAWSTDKDGLIPCLLAAEMKATTGRDPGEVAFTDGQPAANRAVRSPLVGKPAPAIEGTTVDGTAASLGDLKGQWVVVNFFATWCVPCRQEHPELIRFSQAHEAAGDAAVLGVVYSDNAQAVREFRDKEGGGWAMLTDPKGRVALDYGVAGVPESFLISPDGLVVAKLLGGVRASGLDDLLYQAKAGR